MAPSKPAHAIVRYRKHTPSPEKGRFCTGYSTMYQAKWDENKEKCIIYQLPPEILLSIMECLDVPSMYMARQACSLMWSFFNDLSFKWFHYMLKDKKGNIIPGAPPGFKHDALAEHMSDIIKRLLPDGRCRDCQYVYDIWMRESYWRTSNFCTLRLAFHKRLFSPLDEDGREWEKRLRCCPHRHLSFPEAFRLLGMSRNNDARQVVFRCNECSDALGMEEGEEPPTISCDTQQAQNEWTVKVATLTNGQVVTMDLLRQSLKRIDHWLCPHAQSSQEILMKPFCRRRCVCFRESTGTVQRCYGHSRPRERYDCCACLQIISKDEAAVGMFMASTASHGVHCKMCDFQYDWVLDEDRSC